jgi:hypothetical protein
MRRAWVQRPSVRQPFVGLLGRGAGKIDSREEPTEKQEEHAHGVYLCRVASLAGFTQQRGLARVSGKWRSRACAVAARLAALLGGSMGE